MLLSDALQPNTLCQWLLIAYDIPEMFYMTFFRSTTVVKDRFGLGTKTWVKLGKDRGLFKKKKQTFIAPL